MSILSDAGRRLRTLLWLISLHSLAVGVALILHPAALLARSGYAPVHEPFFPTQGGVFHVVMALGYGLAAADPVRRRALIPFAVLVKACAFVFLMTYWLLVAGNQTILFSGLGDGAMSLALALAYRSWLRSSEPGD